MGFLHHSTFWRVLRSQSSQHIESPPEYIEFVGQLKAPVRGTDFPSIATDRDKNILNVTCPRCRNSLPLLCASSKRYDLCAKCDLCLLEFTKTGRATTKQGFPCVKLFCKVPIQPIPFQSQKAHPYPRLQKRKKRGPTEESASNKLIDSKGKKELDKLQG